MWARITGFYHKSAEMINKFALWNSKLKKVEGQFGSGVYNFFNFLKWSMGLNLLMTVLTLMLICVPEHYNDDIIPDCNTTVYKINNTMFPEDYVDDCCTNLYDKNQQFKREPLDVTFSSFSSFMSDIGNILLSLFQGDGYVG